MPNSSHITSGARFWRSVVASAVVAAVSGCSANAPLIPESDAPFLYLILSQALIPTSPLVPADSTVNAFLLTVGTPLSSPYRGAERFEMWRKSDGAPFRWSEGARYLKEPPVGPRGLVLTNGASFVLEEDSSALGLGRRQLRALESYSLRIETGGVVITGEARIPAAPIATLVRTDSGMAIAWNRAEGAAAYFFQADTERFTGFFMTDTVVQLHFDRGDGTPAQPEARIVAYDSNVARYVADSTVGRSGITGAFGLFGAVSSTRLPLPSRVP